MLKLLMVGVGGFGGAVCRYLVAGLVNRLIDDRWLPYGTLAVNIAGCFAIGLLEGLATSRQLFNEHTRALVFVGLLGGFTTYSTFGYESFDALRGGRPEAAAAYIGLHLALGLTAVWLGSLCGRAA